MLLSALLLVACTTPTDPGDPKDTSPPTDDTAADTDTAPDRVCPPEEPGVPQEVTEDQTEAGPYFLRNPASADGSTPTIVFLPGGGGDRGSAEAAQRLYLAADGNERFRIAVLYTDGRNFREKPDRAVDVRDELLACFGGDAAAVHLAGTSNGGVGAFGLFVETGGEGWGSLLGAPGAWETFDTDAILAALGEKPVFMGVGELDDGWLASVQAQADAVAAEGGNVTFEVFEGQGHIVAEDYDETVLFEFWGR